MSTSRKDYVAIAKIISDAQLINCATAEELAVNQATRSRIAIALAAYFRGQNTRFEGARFVIACNL